MVRMQQYVARLVDRVQGDVDSIADFVMACCAAGGVGRRQIGVYGQNGKLEQQLVLLTAMVMGAKQLAMLEAVEPVAVVMVGQMGQEPVSSASKKTATLCSRRVGICAPAVTALSASTDALSVEQEAEPSECTVPSFSKELNQSKLPRVRW